jgi:hypothetical protein
LTSFRSHHAPHGGTSDKKYSVFSAEALRQAKKLQRKNAHLLRKLIAPLREEEVDNYLEFIFVRNVARRASSMKVRETLRALAYLVRAADSYGTSRDRDLLDDLALTILRMLIYESGQPGTKEGCLQFLAPQKETRLASWFAAYGFERVEKALPETLPFVSNGAKLYAQNHSESAEMGIKSRSNLTKQIVITWTALRQAGINSNYRRLSHALNKHAVDGLRTWTQAQVKDRVKKFRRGRHGELLEPLARNSVGLFRFWAQEQGDRS